ncbi:MAG: helix-turn-helix domain-containing protein [Pseudomonadota bacterium]
MNRRDMEYDMMRYAEQPLPEALNGLVAALWTMAGEGRPDAWVEHDATPDGCIEVIHRLRGRSVWGTEQPALFVTGLNLTPVRFRISGDAQFIGLRLWPWAWEMLGGVPCPAIANGWAALDGGSRAGALMLNPDNVMTDMTTAFAGMARHPIGSHVLNAVRVEDIVRTSGRSHRTVQRWFERSIGVTPRGYLRLIRFHRAMVDVATATSLADQAAKGGFADQAHMARDFRELAGIPPRTARARARGPFLPGDPS